MHVILIPPLFADILSFYRIHSPNNETLMHFQHSSGCVITARTNQQPTKLPAKTVP